jgi:hypothetical protein
MGIWEKYEPWFVECLGALEKETLSKNRSKGSKMRGKSKLLESEVQFQEKINLAT